MFQLTAARRRLAGVDLRGAILTAVSTHSRPKTAGSGSVTPIFFTASFNSQPPEDGWVCRLPEDAVVRGFNSQPPEDGWYEYLQTVSVSNARFNSQPPEDGWARPLGLR